MQRFVTDYSNDLFLTELPDLPFRKDKEGSFGEEGKIVNIYPQVRYQKIAGFGGAMTQGSADNLVRLDPDTREKILKSYYGREEGIGYNLCRLTVGSCDFSTEEYSYDDSTEDDFDLKHFSTEHDKKDVFPMVRRALELGRDLKILACPWSPPAWMKTNGNREKGGKLRPECRKVWAEYFCRYIESAEENGIRIDAVTVQNEAKAEQGWESCFYTEEEEADFIHEDLVPALKAHGLERVQVLYWDHNKERAVDRTLTVMERTDPDDTAGIAVHWYSGDHFGALDAVHALRPDKMILASEACTAGNLPHWYDAGEKYAFDILGDLNHFANGWIDWNMVLDSTGRPDHWLDEQMAFKKAVREGTLSEEDMTPEQKRFLLPDVEHDSIWIGGAPVMVKFPEGKVTKTSPYYYMGQIAKFIRPGAVRIGSSVYTEDLSILTAENPDGSLVLVILNRNEQEYPLNIRLSGRIAADVIAAHSIRTYVTGPGERA